MPLSKKTKKRARRLCELQQSALSMSQFAPQRRAAQQTQQPLNGNGIKPLSILMSDSGSD